MPTSRSSPFKVVALLACGLCVPVATAQQESTGVTLRSGFEDFSQFDRPINVVFLGGSITQNAKGHSAMVVERLRGLYPGRKFKSVNAGLSSTCSVTGAFRLNLQELLEPSPDLFIVEFAVNDDQDAGHSREMAIRGMEGVIRQVRRNNRNTRILMVQFVNPGILEKLENGETPVSIAAHEAVAEYYGITTVNVGAALAGGAMDWNEYGGTHPKESGYALATDLIMMALSHREAAPAFPEEPLDPLSYFSARMVDPQEASWLGGWKHAPVGKEILPVGSIRGDYEKYRILRADEPGSTLYLDFHGRAIGAFILAGPDAGIVEIRIDGGEWTRHDLFHRHSRGLNYPRSIIFADNLSPASHQIVLRVTPEKNPGSKGTAASILFFEVNR